MLLINSNFFRKLSFHKCEMFKKFDINFVFYHSTIFFNDRKSNFSFIYHVVREKHFDRAKEQRTNNPFQANL